MTTKHSTKRNYQEKVWKLYNNKINKYIKSRFIFKVCIFTAEIRKGPVSTFSAEEF